jgi:hypothetical protein
MEMRHVQEVSHLRRRLVRAWRLDWRRLRRCLLGVGDGGL